MVDSVARNLKALGFVGARAYCRKVADLAVVVEAIDEVRAAMADGAEVQNPAGLVRWLVTQELESRERHEIHLEAGTPAELRPPRHAEWWVGRGRRGA